MTVHAHVSARAAQLVQDARSRSVVRGLTSCIIPWRWAGQGEERPSILGWLLDKVEDTFPEWELIVSDDGADEGDPWSAARARVNGVAQSHGDVLVILDADTWADHVGRAVDFVRRGFRPWVQPHSIIRRLGPLQTAKYMSTGEVDDQTMRLEGPDYKQWPGGVPTVISRELFLTCPQDQRFVGWGAEDNAWGFALTTLHAEMLRFPGFAVHLYHEPDPVRCQRQRGVSREALNGQDPMHHPLFLRYQAANGDSDAMLQLVNEATTHAGVNAQ